MYRVLLGRFGTGIDLGLVLMLFWYQDNLDIFLRLVWSWDRLSIVLGSVWSWDRPWNGFAVGMVLGSSRDLPRVGMVSGLS